MINQFFKTIVMLLAVGLPAWALLRIFFGLATARRGLRVSLAWEMLLGAFFIYSVVVISLTVVPVPMSIHGDPASPGFSIIPFASIATCCIDANAGLGGSWTFCLENFLGNLFLLFPLGMFLPLVWERFRTGWTVFLMAAAASGSIELIQFCSRYFGSYRTADIDDVILNSVGAFVGFYCFRLLDASSRRSAREQQISGL